MSRKKLYLLFVFNLFLMGCSSCYAQKHRPDSNYIRYFEKPNIMEAYIGTSSTNFKFSSPDERKANYKLVANSSAYIGADLNYKWLTLNYSIAIPGTQVDRNVRLEYTSASTRFSGKQTVFRPFYSSYNGLLIPDKDSLNVYTLFKGIQFTRGGIDFYYYFNKSNFSFHTANYFSNQQIKSAGSLFIMATPEWQKIKWKDPSRDIISDTATFNLLSSNPQWLSVILRAGYAYIFAFQKGKWRIAPSVIAGAGGVRAINTPNKSLNIATDIQLLLDAGYDGPNYYVYLKAWWDNLKTNLFYKNLNQIYGDFSITGGYRFHHFRKKIMRIL